MPHMTLQEWDRRMAPFLATIRARSKHIQDDAVQIRAWVAMLPAAAVFETEAIAELEQAQFHLEFALNEVRQALEEYSKKEKVS